MDFPGLHNLNVKFRKKGKAYGEGINVTRQESLV